MNTQSTAMPEPFESRGVAPAVVTAMTRYYWSVRRELWENRAVYVAPLIAAAAFLVGFLIQLVKLRRNFSTLALDPAHQHHLLFKTYEVAAALIMTAAFIVGIFYTLDALYGERRDRSILFWKSLPVSDVTVVLAKVTVPAVILPLLSLLITIATELIMIVLISVIFAGSGINTAGMWTEASFFRVALVMFYHIVTNHGLWYAPIYGWLLLVSAWAPRAPFMWAFLPPFVICGVEKLAFNTEYCLHWLGARLAGPAHQPLATGGSHVVDPMAELIPAHFFAEPGLWIGLAIAAAFVFAAVRLRRHQGPI